MTPVIFRIVPDHIEVDDQVRVAQIQVFGEHFDESAAVEVIGCATCFETIRVSDSELHASFDFYRGEGKFNVGLIVLNDPTCFAANSASNVVPISVRNQLKPSSISADDIPF